MKLITISGQHAAGKKDVADAVLEFFGEEFLNRVVPCTTRNPRPDEVHGREYFFISPQEFESLYQAGEFVFEVRIRCTQRSGTLKRELFGKRNALVDVVPEGARQMRDLILKEKGQALLIFIHAPEEQREARFKVRDPQISQVAIEQMIRYDPVRPGLGLYKDFDLIVENPDGALKQTVATVIEAIKGFII